MAYVLRAEANGLSLEIPVESAELADREEVASETSIALWKALERTGTLDEDWEPTEEGRMLLNEWAARLSNAGFWMPEGCSLDEILFNLKEANVFGLLTADVTFPLKLEEQVSEKEAEEMLDWEVITSGLVQAEPDWM